jgi:uncharacterized membrane protein
MAELIAIGYPDTVTAHAAADEAERLAEDLILQPDAIAVIVRKPNGRYKVTTNHHVVGQGTTWGMFWGFLFGLLFFVPVLGIDKEFESRVRDMLQPGTSALFLIVDQVTPGKAVEALSSYGGTVLKTSLSAEAEKELQEALHAEAQPA